MYSTIFRKLTNADFRFIFYAFFFLQKPSSRRIFPPALNDGQECSNIYFSRQNIVTDDAIGDFDIRETQLYWPRKQSKMIMPYVIGHARIVSSLSDDHAM